MSKIVKDSKELIGKKAVKMFRASIKSIDPDEHKATVLVSTGAKDRDAEMLPPEAFKKRLKHYKEHPVLLSQHGSFGSLLKQIGEASNVKVTDEGVEATFEWYVGKGNPEADWAWVLAEKDIGAFSVGFIVHDYEQMDFDKTGVWRKYTEVELIEVSQVLIPSNRDAVMRRQSLQDGVEAELCELAIKSLAEEDFREMPIDPQIAAYVGSAVAKAVSEAKESLKAEIVALAGPEAVKKAVSVALEDDFSGKVMKAVSQGLLDPAGDGLRQAVKKAVAPHYTETIVPGVPGAGAAPSSAIPAADLKAVGAEVASEMFKTPAA